MCYGQPAGPGRRGGVLAGARVGPSRRSSPRRRRPWPRPTNRRGEAGAGCHPWLRGAAAHGRRPFNALRGLRRERHDAAPGGRGGPEGPDRVGRHDEAAAVGVERGWHEHRARSSSPRRGGAVWNPPAVCGPRGRGGAVLLDRIRRGYVDRDQGDHGRGRRRGSGVGGGVLAPRSRSGGAAQPDLDLRLGPDAPTESERGLRSCSVTPGDAAPRSDTTRRGGGWGRAWPRGGARTSRRWPTTSPPGGWSPGRRG